ncbi:RNA helicase [Salvia divinorum]|uniref:RNA helicase n=1 Tax=Salvia divinorum TaxID=28513 RepID=A0ABD1HS18_SALDI
MFVLIMNTNVLLSSGGKILKSGSWGWDMFCCSSQRCLNSPSTQGFVPVEDIKLEDIKYKEKYREKQRKKNLVAKQAAKEQKKSGTQKQQQMLLLPLWPQEGVVERTAKESMPRYNQPQVDSLAVTYENFVLLMACIQSLAIQLELIVFVGILP